MTIIKQTKLIKVMGYAIINSVPQVKITSNRREQFLFFFFNLHYYLSYIFFENFIHICNVFRPDLS